MPQGEPSPSATVAATFPSAPSRPHRRSQAAAPAEPPMARLSLAVAPWGEVYVDGKRKGGRAAVDRDPARPGQAHHRDSQYDLSQLRTIRRSRRQRLAEDPAQVPMTSVTICLPRRASIRRCARCAGLRELCDATRQRADDAAKGRERRPAGCATAEGTGCAARVSPHAPSKSEQELDKGIRSYEDGEYKTSAKQLQAALDLGLDAARDRARAHKYLAFIDLRLRPKEGVSR